VVVTFDVVVGDWYYSKDVTHNKNERIYMGKGKECVINLVQFWAHASSKKN
jgi:hypothetical protein